MTTIRKNRIRRRGNSVTVELPDDFTGDEVDVIVMASGNSETNQELSELELSKWRQDLIKFYSDYSIDLKKHPFNREELYDRP